MMKHKESPCRDHHFLINLCIHSGPAPVKFSILESVIYYRRNNTHERNVFIHLLNCRKNKERATAGRGEWGKLKKNLKKKFRHIFIFYLKMKTFLEFQEPTITVWRLQSELRWRKKRFQNFSSNHTQVPMMDENASFKKIIESSCCAVPERLLPVHINHHKKYSKCTMNR